MIRRLLLGLIAALCIGASGCATVAPVEPQATAQTVQQTEAPVLCATKACDTARDVEPVESGIYEGREIYFAHEDYVPWLNAQAPPDHLALFTLPWIGSTHATAVPIPDGFWPLQTTLVPSWSAGSGTPTFTRATTAYQTDFEAKQNLVLSGEARFQGGRRVANHITTSSQDMRAGGGWTNDAAATVTYGFSDPLGGNTATKIVPSITAPSGSGTYNATGVASGTVTDSIWLKGGSGGEDLQFGVPGTATILTITSSWRRYSVTNTSTDQNLIVRARTQDQVIYACGIQREVVTGQANQNPSEYVSVGVLSAPYHGAGVDGVKYFSTLNGNTVASNVVTEVTGAPIVAGASGVNALAPVDAGGPFGYLAEGAGTQLVTPTAAIRDMTDASWTLGATMTRARTSIGADGVANTATRLTGGAVAATNTITQTLVAAASSRTYSVLMKRITGTGTVLLTQGVSTCDITSQLVASQWVLVQCAQSVLNVAYGIQINTNGDAVDADMNQFEAGGFATSRMVSAGAARNADVLTYALAGNIDATKGSGYAELSSAWTGTSALRHDIISSASGTPLYVESSAGKLSINDGAAQLGNVFTGSATIQKVASMWGGSSANTYISGTASSALTFDGDMSMTTALHVGNNNGGTQWDGTIRNLRVWLSTVSNAQMSAQTAFYEAFMPYRVAWLDNRNEAANDDLYRIVATGGR